MIDRLREEMSRLGINARELSERANLGPSFVYDLLSGKSSNPTTKKLSSIAEALGVGLPYLVSGSNSNHITYGKDENFIAIPMLLNTDQDRKETPVYKQFLFHKNLLAENIGANPNNLKIVTITDDNMEPVLYKNDSALVDTGCRTPEKPGIFIILSGTSMVARHLEFAPDQNLTKVFISRDPKKFAPYSCDINDVEVIGRVVWVGRSL